MKIRDIHTRRVGRLGAVIALVAVAAAAALAGAALASTAQVKDAQGDSQKGHADIKEVKAVTGRRAVVWTVEAYEDFPTAKAPCVGISLEAKKHPRGDTYEVCGDGTIQDFQHGTTAGHAMVKRPDGSTIVYRIGRSHFKHRKAIAWETQVRDNGCKELCDQAPEGPGTHVVQKL